MKRFFLGSVLLVSVNAYSLNDRDMVFVDGCESLIKIYETRNKKSELAAVFTSVADSFQAGYCRGVLEEQSSCNSGWHDMARFIAAQRAVSDQYSSRQQLINAACSR